MSNDIDRWELVVEKLVKQTLDKAIIWSKSEVMPSTVDRVSSPVYVALVAGRPIRVYEREFERWLDEDQATIDRDIEIELLDEVARTPTAWALPKTSKRFALFDAIVAGQVRADDFRDRFLQAS